MKVKRYLAATSREALRQVKEELGANAVILSNRKIKNGVEIMAFADDEMSNLVETPTGNTANSKLNDDEQGAFEVSMKALPLIHNKQESDQSYPEMMSPSLAHDIIAEIQAMRSTLEDQLATVAWGNFTQQKPEKVKILRTLLDIGFSPLLSRRLVEKLAADLNYEQSLKQTMAVLASNLRTVTNDEMIEKGGVYALIGPTGVGKTTTTAKLAARCVIRHGADRVALLTTDSYRIGGHEQLRIYGQLLGVPVRNIKDTDDLQLTLSELGNNAAMNIVLLISRNHFIQCFAVGSRAQYEQLLYIGSTVAQHCNLLSNHLIPLTHPHGIN